MKRALEEKSNQIQERMRDLIPSHMHDAVMAWLWDGREPGSFLSAVLEGDFKGACLNADSTNAPRLADYGKFFTWYMPMGCWGSISNAREWNKRGGWNGMLTADPESPEELDSEL